MRANSLLPLFCAISFLPYAGFAQENKSISEKGVSAPVRHKLSVFIAGGSSFGSGMKDSLFIQNGWNVNGGIYMPLLSVNKQAGDFSAGIEAALSYAQQKADGGKSAYTNNYHLQDGNIAPAFAGNTPHASSFQILAGPKAEWRINRFSVSPTVLFGYMSLKRNAYSLSGTVDNPKQPGQNKNISFITATDYSASGFVLQPKVEIGYHVTSCLSLFVTGAIAFGPSFENNFNYWKPQGSAGTGNTYSYDQFVTGGAKTSVNSKKWQTTTVGIGIRYTMPSRLSMTPTTTRQTSRLSMTPTTTRQTQGKSFGEKVASGLQTGSAAQEVNVSTDNTRKTSGAVSSSYAAGRAIQSGDTTNKMPSRLSMTPTTTRQTQGSNFGEKVASGLQSGSSAQAVNVSTDSTKKMPGAVSSSYAAGRAIQPGDTTNKMPSRLSMTPTTTRQTQGSNFGEKVASGLQSGASATNMVAGQPIGGIVVKGGKNTQEKIISVTSDNNGEVLLNGLEAGSYLFTLTESPGQSIGGIVVKGGKNPGGSFTNLTVNRKGQIGFEVLESGNYKLIIEASDPSLKKTEKSKEKVVEKATSGLKDTLKTQV